MEKTRFELCVKKHQQALHWFALKICGNEADAEDAIQQAYVAAWIRRADFATCAGLSFWLMRVIRNWFLSFKRGSRREVTNLFERPEDDDLAEFEVADDLTPSPDENLIKQACVECVRDNIPTLRVVDQVIIVLRVDLELEYLAIALVLNNLATGGRAGWNENTVKLRFYRARVTIRQACAQLCT